MKKILIMMLVSCMMMICSVSFAGDDHKDLGKQQAVAEKMMSVFGSAEAPLYAEVSAGFSANMKKAVTEEAFAELKKQVNQKFGKMKEAKFFTFQRFDQADRVTYIASFSKEKIVSMIFAFDKKNKLVDFAFTPVQQPAAKAEEKK